MTIASHFVRSLPVLGLLWLVVGCSGRERVAEEADADRAVPAVNQPVPSPARERPSSALAGQEPEGKEPTAGVEAKSCYDRALALSAQGRLVEAAKGFSDAIQLCPNYADAYADRGAALTALGDDDGGIADFDRALRLGQVPKEQARTYSRRAMARLGKGDLDGALSDTNEALKVSSECISALSTRSIIWQRKGDGTRAIADAVKLTEVQPDNPLGHTMLAMMYAGWPDAACRDAERAIASAKRACEITDWKNPQALAAMAAGYAEKGDFDEAIRWQKKVEELTPEHWRDAVPHPLQLYAAKKPYRMENIGTKSKRPEGREPADSADQDLHHRASNQPE